jgi:hypothetical protein
MRKSALIGVGISVSIAVFGAGVAISTQDKYTVEVPNGLAFSEFRGYEDWPVIAISENGPDSVGQVEWQPIATIRENLQTELMSAFGAKCFRAGIEVRLGAVPGGRWARATASFAARASAADFSIRGIKAPLLLASPGRAPSPPSATTSVKSKTSSTGFESRALTILATGSPAICGSIGPSTENSPSTISSAASAISVPPDMAHTGT